MELYSTGLDSVSDVHATDINFDNFTGWKGGGRPYVSDELGVKYFKYEADAWKDVTFNVKIKYEDAKELFEHWLERVEHAQRMYKLAMKKREERG